MLKYATVPPTAPKPKCSIPLVNHLDSPSKNNSSTPPIIIVVISSIICPPINLELHLLALATNSTSLNSIQILIKSFQIPSSHRIHHQIRILKRPSQRNSLWRRERRNEDHRAIRCHPEKQKSRTWSLSSPINSFKTELFYEWKKPQTR